VAARARLAPAARCALSAVVGSADTPLVVETRAIPRDPTTAG